MVKIFFNSLFLFGLYGHATAAEVPSAPIERPPLESNEVAEIPYDNNQFYEELTSILFTLGLLVIALICISWFVRRMQSTRLQFGNTGSRIKVLEQRQISAKTIIYMIHVNNKALVIADSMNGVTCLSEFPLSLNDVEENPASSSMFDKIYKKTST